MFTVKNVIIGMISYLVLVHMIVKNQTLNLNEKRIELLLRLMNNFDSLKLVIMWTLRVNVSKISALE